MTEIRHDWKTEEVYSLLTSPLEDLLARAHEIHKTHAAQDVQQCMLLSVKTGACPEDCGYCSQSAHFKTDLKTEPLMAYENVMDAAVKAKGEGASRFCMGAAWRDVPTDRRFDQVLELIHGVSKLGMEVCCTMGMASEDQLRKMKTAGLSAYNHNLDTSREHYSKIISTRTYDDRIETLKSVRKAGVQMCCGGILGMGESLKDRAALLTELSSFNPHPESVPINLLVPVEGTPLEEQKRMPFEEFLRAIATARIVMPKARVRLSAGRNTLSEAEQLLCFEAGANSIFIGDKLLTTPNVPLDQDKEMMRSVVSAQ